MLPQLSPTTIYVDNLPALLIAIASNIPTKSRYIHAEHFIRQCIETDDCIIHENIPGFGNVVSEMRQTADAISDIYFL